MSSVRLKLWQKILYYLLFLTAIFIAVGLPIYVLADKVVIEYWHVKKVRFSFITAIAIGGIGLSAFLPLKSWYKRKLNAMEVANELNVIGLTSPLLKWLLLFLQFAIPLAVITSALYGFNYLTAYIAENIDKVKPLNYRILIEFYGYFIGGFVIFVLNDYLKIHFLLKNEVAQQVKLDEKKAKLVAKKTLKIAKKKD